ncbi:UNVERIFIED_CONTAM: hypothetical protein HDU68_011002 [Siphonaria sp. JEL0065]|nr:hypothetical protein HDU68_011002 [Siphonaria sp. JEL0065]
MSATTANPNCFVIQHTTTTLQDFVGYSLLKDAASNISDTASMDAFLLARLDTNQAYVNGFKSFFDCPNWPGTGQRFHMSFYQGELIFLAQNNPKSPCPQPLSTQNAQLCQSTCLSAQQSLSAIFSNPSWCNQATSTAVKTNRDSTVQGYGQICALLPPSKSNCIATVKAERQTCGFLVRSDAVAYCGDGGAGVMTNDRCCQIFLNGTGIAGSTGTGGVGAIGAGATTTTSPKSIGVEVNGVTTVGISNNDTVSGIVGSSTSTPPAGGLTATTIAIAVGFTGGLLIIAGLYFFIAYRKKRIRDSQAEKPQQPNQSPTNIFQDQPTNTQRQSYFAGAARDRETSQEQILSNAAPVPIGGVINKNRAGNAEYEEEFNYAPTNGSIARVSRSSFLRDVTLARPTRSQGQQLQQLQQPQRRSLQQQQDYRISVNEVNRNGNFASVYSDAPSNYMSDYDNTTNNQYSMYSKAQVDGGRINGGYTTMDSAISEAFKDKKSQYSSYVSEYSDYQASEYQPVSYALPNNATKNQEGRGTDDAYLDVLTDNNNNRLSYTGTDDGGMFKVKVLFPYEKDMDDELALKPGEIVTVTNLFDDGWAHGICGNNRGAFPLACVVPLDSVDGSTSVMSESTRMSVLKRRSSLGSNRF